MAIHLELTDAEARLLIMHLVRYLEHLDQELVRTDKHDLQHRLALEIEELQGVASRLRTVSSV